MDRVEPEMFPYDSICPINSYGYIVKRSLKFLVKQPQIHFPSMHERVSSFDQLFYRVKKGDLPTSIRSSKCRCYVEFLVNQLEVIPNRAGSLKRKTLCNRLLNWHFLSCNFFKLGVTQASLFQYAMT